jgi:tungstate transport system substrate-binding protein
MKNARVWCAVFVAVLLLSGQRLFAMGRTESGGRIILATTTSTNDSGLLDFILPAFTAETGINVDVVSVGTGAALRIGRDGQADVLLVHAKAQELEFVASGHGLERHDVMYNDFVIVGPEGIIPQNRDALYTMREIARRNLAFVSRGDDSGTHVMELELWKAASVNPATFSGYLSAGQGMGATLRMAGEMSAFTLSDRATWLVQKPRGLEIVCEGDPPLFNQYGVIAVNPKIHAGINARGAAAFVEWILSPQAQTLIAEFGVAEFGKSLFTPNAQR